MTITIHVHSRKFSRLKTSKAGSKTSTYWRWPFRPCEYFFLLPFQSFKRRKNRPFIFSLEVPHMLHTSLTLTSDCDPGLRDSLPLNFKNSFQILPDSFIMFFWFGWCFVVDENSKCIGDYQSPKFRKMCAILRSTHSYLKLNCDYYDDDDCQAYLFCWGHKGLCTHWKH